MTRFAMYAPVVVLLSAANMTPSLKLMAMMDVPRLGCLLALWQRSRPTNNSLDLALLEVVHVDMDAIYAV